jgi:hypothetical protein
MDLGRTTGEETIDDGVNVGGKEFLTTGILGTPETERLWVVLARQPFHVVENQDTNAVCKIGAGILENPRIRGRSAWLTPYEGSRATGHDDGRTKEGSSISHW